RGLDGAVFDAQPATSVRPAGLLNNVTALNGDTTGATAIEKALIDVGNLVSEIASSGVIAAPDGVVFVAHTARALALRALTGSAVTVLGSSVLNPAWLIAVATDGVASGYSGVPTIETSMAAELVFNDVPAEIVDAGGAPGAPIKSAFQSDVL